MKPSREPNAIPTARRRGGPVTRMILLWILIPPCGGCWWHHHTREPILGDSTSTVAKFYEDATANTSAAYDTGVELELPMNPPPLSSRHPEADEKWEMTLREAIEIALQNSKVIRQINARTGAATARQDITAYDPAIAEALIQRELARFDTQFVFNLFWSKDDVQINNNVAGGSTVGVSPGNPFIFRQDTFGGAAGRNSGLPNSGDILTLRKATANGGEITAGFNTDYDFSNVSGSRAFRAAYNTRLFTAFRQPLLQGASSEVNRAPILIRRMQADSALWDFKGAIAELIQQVEQTYWALVIADAQVQALNREIELTLEIIRNIELKVEQDTGNELELAQARQQYQSIRRERTAALQGAGPLAPARRRLIGGPLLDTERQLRGLLGLPPSDGRRIVPVDEPIVAPVELDWPNTVMDAFTYNPEIQSFKLQVAQQREALKIAFDGLKPRLDAFIRKEFQGLGTEFDDSIREVNHGGFGSVTFGLQFQYEFGYRRAASEVQQRRNELERQRELLRAKGLEVEHTLNNQFPRIAAIADAYDASKKALAAAEEQLNLAKFLYDEGRIPLNQLQDAVNSYTNAFIEEIADRSAFQLALVDLEVTKGTIFQYTSSHIHEEPWPADAYPQAVRQAEDRARAIEWYHPRPPKYEVRDRMSVYRKLDEVFHDADHQAAPADMPAPYQEDSAPIDVGPMEIPLDLGGWKPAKQPPPDSELILPTGVDLDPP